MPKVDQRGVAHLFLLIFILAGIVLGVYLINQKTQLFPFAASNPIPASCSVSGPCPSSSATSTPSPSPSIAPSPSSSPSPSPAQSPSQSPQSFGKAISLMANSGTEDVSFVITRSTNQYDELLLKDPFTIEFWFKISKLPDKDITLLSEGNRLKIIVKKQSDDYGILQVTTSNSTSSNTYITNPSPVTINDWHHFGFTHKGGEQTIYIDGQSRWVGSKPFADDRSEAVVIGSVSSGVVKDIDEVRLSHIPRYPTPTGPGSYQVPVAPFGFDNNTKILLHMDGSLVPADGTGSYRGDFTGFNKYIDSLYSVNPSPSPFKLGDTDGDNDVDIFDYNIVLTDFGKNILPGKPADFDKDGDVDIFDYNTIVTYFGT